MTQALAVGLPPRPLLRGDRRGARARRRPRGPAKLAGERRLESIPGFDFGNSPREVAAEPEVGDAHPLDDERHAAARRRGRALRPRLRRLAAQPRRGRGGGARARARTSPCSAPACSASSRSTTRTARAGSRRRSAATAPTPRRRRSGSRGTFADARDGLGASRSAWNLRSHGLEADIDWCAQRERARRRAALRRHGRAGGGGRGRKKREATPRGMGEPPQIGLRGLASFPDSRCCAA